MSAAAGTESDWVSGEEKTVGMGVIDSGAVSMAGVLIGDVAADVSVVESVAGVGDTSPPEGAKGFRQPASNKLISITAYVNRRYFKVCPPNCSFAQERFH